MRRTRVSVLTALSAVRDPARITPIREPAGSDGRARSRGSFDVPVGKAGLGRHSSVLRGAGLVERATRGRGGSAGPRREEFEKRPPGLRALLLRDDHRPSCPGAVGPDGLRA
ncbi:transcriptional regulator [Streptomyces sp. NBC_00377]|uniref:transcriptional regulator n=1 Tax=unclassified Streptomyces TaxID=2593676 RepID=UPI002E23E37B|nr:MULTISPECIES: transcriptional regulator [unclassified Streptomyces]